MILSAEQLAVLTEEERGQYYKLLERELIYASPLDLACVLNPGTQRRPHQEMINDTVVALCRYRLYADGPGPASSLYYSITDYETQKVTIYPALGMEQVPFNDPDLDEYWFAHPNDPHNRVILRLGIAVPPRHGKSFLVSEYLPIWYALENPGADVVLATYSDDFAQDEWGVKCRDKLVDHGDLLGLEVRGGSRAPSKRQRLTDGTQFRFVGAGGSITGTGYQLGIIDDPFKNQDDALSEAERNRKGNWYGSTWTSRKTKDDGVIPIEIMMFTRWHEDDLAGRYVYDDDGNVKPDWYMLHLPALAVDDDDVLGRRAGQALCPQVMTRVELERLRKEDPVWFASLYQGAPSAGEDGQFGNYRYYKRGKHLNEEGFYDDEGLFYPDLDCVFFETVDLAATISSRSDWSVISLWSYHRESEYLFLVNVVRERVESDTHPAWLTRHHDRRAKFMGIESKTFGITAIQSLRKQGSFVVKELKADRDKVARSIPAADLCRAGRVHHPSSAPWLLKYESELNAGLVTSKHDDQIDTFGYAASEIENLPRYMPPPVPKELTTEEKCWRQVEKKQKRRRRARR